MLNKPIDVPKAFRELHGDKTTLANIALVYAAGAGVAAFAVLGLRAESLAPWKLGLVGLIFMDVAGGVVANLSGSTHRYYQGKNRLRALFLIAHALQPGILLGLFPQYAGYFVFCWAYVMAGCFALFFVRRAEWQQQIAAALVAIGASIALLSFDLPARALYLFGILYMVKLLLGFSVRRPDFG